MIKLHRGNYLTFEKSDLKPDGLLIEIGPKGKRIVHNKPKIKTLRFESKTISGMTLVVEPFNKDGDMEFKKVYDGELTFAYLPFEEVVKLQEFLTEQINLQKFKNE